MTWPVRPAGPASPASRRARRPGRAPHAIRAPLFCRRTSRRGPAAPPPAVGPAASGRAFGRHRAMRRALRLRRPAGAWPAREARRGRNPPPRRRQFRATACPPPSRTTECRRCRRRRSPSASATPRRGRQGADRESPAPQSFRAFRARREGRERWPEPPPRHRGAPPPGCPRGAARMAKDHAICARNPARPWRSPPRAPALPTRLRRPNKAIGAPRRVRRPCGRAAASDDIADATGLHGRARLARGRPTPCPASPSRGSGPASPPCRRASARPARAAPRPRAPR